MKSQVLVCHFSLSSYFQVELPCFWMNLHVNYFFLGHFRDTLSSPDHTTLPSFTNASRLPYEQTAIFRNEESSVVTQLQTSAMKRKSLPALAWVRLLLWGQQLCLCFSSSSLPPPLPHTLVWSWLPLALDQNDLEVDFLLSVGYLSIFLSFP